MEGLLAGVLHQSITARRVDQIRALASGGPNSSSGGSASPMPSSPYPHSAAWRVASITAGGSDWEGGGGRGGRGGGGRSRRASVDNLLMDLRSKSRAKLDKSATQ